MVHFVSSTRCFFCVNFDKRNIFEIFHTFILLLQNYNQCINIPKTVSEILTMGESIQIKKVHSVYITLWTLHLRKEGDSNPRYPFEYVSLANWWFQPLTHPSKGRFVVDVIFFKCSAKISGIFETANFFALFYFGNNRYFCPIKVLLRCV